MDKKTNFHFFEQQINHWSTVFKNRIPISFYKEIVLPRLKKESDTTWKAETLYFRNKIKPAIQSLAHSLLKDYFQDKHTVLELGAGPLHEGESYISGLFRPYQAFDWTFSDCTGEGELTLDLTDGFSWNGQPFDRLVGCNILDTLPYCDLKMAFIKLRGLLQNDQIFLHFADLNFFTTAFLDACTINGYVLFPASNEIESIYRLPLHLYKDTLRQQRSLMRDRESPSFSEEELHFLELWGNQSLQITAIAINNAFMTKQDMEPLANLARLVFGNRLEKIHIQQCFESHLRQAATNAGWMIEECGFRSESVDIYLSQGAINNCFTADPFGYKVSWDATIPPGWERITSKIHVFAAKKRLESFTQDRAVSF